MDVMKEGEITEIRQSEATLGLGCTRHEEQWSVLNTAGKLMANSKQAARGEFLS